MTGIPEKGVREGSPFALNGIDASGLGRWRVCPETGDAIGSVGHLGTAPGSSIITTRGLSKSFPGGRTVLENVSVDIAGDRAVALIGANGAGKSTLLRCLVGLLPLSAGEVEILGERFSHQPNAGQRRRLRSQLGFVFQFHGLVSRLSALSNVVHGALGRGGGPRSWHQALATSTLRAEALSALDRVGLADRALTRAGELSGGQSQRVAIARAIVHKPRLLIADEPVASLDPAAGTEVMELFRALTDTGDQAIVYTTHNMAHALAYSDRVIALRAGSVVLDAPTRTLSHRDLEPIYRD